MMKKIIYYSSVAFLINATAAVTGNAQSKFLIPERSPDYKSYMYFEDCLGAATRINMVQKNLVAVIDTVSEKREPKFMLAVPKPVKDTGQICSNRWSIDSVESKFINRWGDDFMNLGRSADVRKMYARYIDSIPASERFDARRAVWDLYSKYLEESLLDEFMELWADYRKNIPGDSVPLKIFAPAGDVAVWVRLWQPRLADSVLDDYIEIVAGIPPERMKPFAFLTDRFYPNVKLVKEPVILSKLLESTTSYSNYVRELWTKIGNYTPLASPIDSVAPKILGNWWYAPKKADNNAMAASRLTDIPSSRPVPGKINLISFIESGCHASSFRSWGKSKTAVRLNGEIEGDKARGEMCARTIAAINRLKEIYPDLEVTIVTKTFGSFGNILAGPPETEAETFAKYIIEHNKLDAYVAITETENFRLAGLDNRRVDLPTENEDNYFISNIRNGGHLNVLLVDPEGKIFYSGLLALGDEENAARNLIGTVLKRSQSHTIKQ